jgi:hypothetical protein
MSYANDQVVVLSNPRVKTFTLCKNFSRPHFGEGREGGRKEGRKGGRVEVNTVNYGFVS